MQNMNKQIQEYAYMAASYNPAAVIQPLNLGVNSKQFLRWAFFSSSHLTPNYKGWQFKALASGAAIGTIMQLTCACPTATTQPTRTAIVTTITAVVGFVWRLSRCYQLLKLGV